jgi:cytosine deaminase
VGGGGDTLILRGVHLADSTTTDVRIDGSSGTISAVGAGLRPEPGDATVDLDGYLLLPAPVEPHAHLDKAFLAERIANPSGDLLGAIEAMQAGRHTLTVDDIVDRAERAVRLLVANGVTAIRSHADTMSGHGLRSVEGLVEVRRRVADLVDLQIVALMSWPVTGTAGAEHRALLRDALAAGADVVGGCPHLDEDPEAANEVLLEIAAGSGRRVDLHTDETLDPAVLGLRDLAARVVKSGFSHGVTASHCVSLGMQPVDVQREVAGEVAAAGISVVTLPQTNLFLQGRDTPVAMPRGLTAIRALRDAGATVAGGADNLQDPFNLVGRGDPLETAALLVMAGHLQPDEAYEAVSGASRTALGLPRVAVEPGCPAELLAVRAQTVREAIGSAPADRVVIHRGRVVSRSRVVTEP